MGDDRRTNRSTERKFLMFKLISRLGAIAAATAVPLAVAAGPAAASVTRYHESNGTVVTITTPDTVSTPVGTETRFPVTVSVDGPSAVAIANEKFLTAYGWGDSQWDGLSFASYGCWGLSLAPGHSCTSTVRFAPTSVGSHTENYMLATGFGNLYGRFTATGVRARVIAPTPSPPLAY
ncbi:MAG TPA: hypothetical protein VGO71_11945 [Baekduia sp.]|nr:hypothetical protein [Baekduia sp.]